MGLYDSVPIGRFFCHQEVANRCVSSKTLVRSYSSAERKCSNKGTGQSSHGEMGDFLVETLLEEALKAEGSSGQ